MLLSYVLGGAIPPIAPQSLDPPLDGQKAFRETIPITNDDKGGNPATTNAIHRIVL